ncbi:hypothetical protein VCV18_000115 [Metarhizium anisopliae]
MLISRRTDSQARELSSDRPHGNVVPGLGFMRRQCGGGLGSISVHHERVDESRRLSLDLVIQATTATLNAKQGHGNGAMTPEHSEAVL